MLNAIKAFFAGLVDVEQEISDDVLMLDQPLLNEMDLIHDLHTDRIKHNDLPRSLEHCSDSDWGVLNVNGRLYAVEKWVLAALHTPIRGCSGTECGSSSFTFQGSAREDVSNARSELSDMYPEVHNVASATPIITQH